MCFVYFYNKQQSLSKICLSSPEIKQIGKVTGTIPGASFTFSMLALHSEVSQIQSTTFDSLSSLVENETIPEPLN